LNIFREYKFLGFQENLNQTSTEKIALKKLRLNCLPKFWLSIENGFSLQLLGANLNDETKSASPKFWYTSKIDFNINV
jgi:hypothetical protein